MFWWRGRPIPSFKIIISLIRSSLTLLNCSKEEIRTRKAKKRQKKAKHKKKAKHEKIEIKNMQVNREARWGVRGGDTDEESVQHSHTHALTHSQSSCAIRRNIDGFCLAGRKTDSESMENTRKT